MAMTGMAGRVAVVTGVTSGIGEAVAARLLADGARVVGLGRSTDRLAAAAARWGPSFTPVRADLAVRADRRRALAFLGDQLPRVDIIVNNAAQCEHRTPLDLDAEAWADLMEVNVLAGIDLVKALAGGLAPEGHVINVSSATTRHAAQARFSPYALTKTAVERFTEGLQLELAPKGAKVTTIAPGLVDTPIFDQVPAWLSADDVADAVMWILSRPPSVVASEIVLRPRFQAR
jgi:NAD(P)-dependent dehydrogenase (short-subunit alcohol dehydrogenase family)